MTCKILHYNDKKTIYVYNGMQSCAYGKRVWYTYMDCIYGKHFYMLIWYMYMVTCYAYINSMLMVCLYGMFTLDERSSGECEAWLQSQSDDPA